MERTFAWENEISIEVTNSIGSGSPAIEIFARRGGWKTWSETLANSWALVVVVFVNVDEIKLSLV